MPIIVTCYGCSTIEECKTCGQEVEIEGITYDLDDFEQQKQVDSVLYGLCPVCGSHRVEVQ